MTSQHRHWRAVRRGRKNPATYDVRNRKAEKQFDRWWSGHLMQRVDNEHVRGWQLTPTGRGLIHKGRKPR